MYLLGSDNLDIKKNNEFIVYQGSHGDRGAEIADLILPSAAFTEQNGLYENLEGRVQECKKASYPIGEALEDWKILNLILKALGKNENLLNFDSLRKEVLKLIPNFSKLNELPNFIDYELINILVIFFLGSVLGLIILSNFLSFISKKYPIHLNHLIIGFVSGTLPVVWPWNKIDTEISQTDLLNFETIFAFLIILLSVILIIYINHSVDKKNLRINR